MIQKFNNQNVSHNAFSLIEMIIVLIVMWIMLMVTLLLSWDQIQKVRDKTVKESILAQMQSRYSRNLGSSSFWGMMYDHLDVELLSWGNEISFNYYTWNNESPSITDNFTDNYEIKYIKTNYYFDWDALQSIDSIKLKYTPYKISCKIWDWEDSDNNVVVVVRVNDSQNYCFEIKQKNCRLIEISDQKCEELQTYAHIK